MTFGDRLDALMKARRIKQKDVAGAVGVNHCTVSNWKREVRSPSFEVAVKLSEALHVPLSAFAYDEACERCVEMIEEGKL